MSRTLATEPTARRIAGYGGVGIHVWDYGGGGPPLVLCHCTGTLARIWDPVVAELDEAFRVCAPDTRGHGDSDTPEDPEAYSWIHTGRDLLNVIDALDLGSGLVAAGHSAGAAQIAYAEWLKPGTFSRALLIDPIIGPAESFSGPNPLAEGARRRRNVFKNRAYARERLGSKPPMNAWDPRALEAYIAHGLADRADGRVELKCPGATEAEVYEHSGATDLYEHLGDLELEVTLVTSDRSDVRMLAELQRNRFKQCTFVQLEGPSHFIPQEQPGTVATLIREHLS